VEVAEEERCDLIIMGSKKKKGIFSRLFGDHIVENVIDQAPCPVYVVGI
jgi:nucleotide-binding universal stress UspA family protein